MINAVRISTPRFLVRQYTAKAKRSVLAQDKSKVKSKT